MKFSEELRKTRKEKGYSQDDLALLLGVTRQTVYRWENDLAMPTVDNIAALNKALDRDFFAVCGGKPAAVEPDTEDATLVVDDKQENETKYKKIFFLIMFVISTLTLVFAASETFILYEMISYTRLKSIDDYIGPNISYSHYIDKSGFYAALIVSILLFMVAVAFLVLLIRSCRKNIKERRGTEI